MVSTPREIASDRTIDAKRLRCNVRSAFGTTTTPLKLPLRWENEVRLSP